MPEYYTETDADGDVDMGNYTTRVYESLGIPARNKRVVFRNGVPHVIGDISRGDDGRTEADMFEHPVPEHIGLDNRTEADMFEHPAPAAHIGLDDRTESDTY
jgi:hypothetical protein